MPLTAQFQALIDKQDTFELLQSQITAILAVEIAAQQAFAVAASKDPSLWKLRVYQSRTNPWQVFEKLDTVDKNKRLDTSPIVNVDFSSCTFDTAKGDPVERQQGDGIFNVDCYAYGVARSDGGTGHVPSDQDANDNLNRSIRLVRNILMSSYYTYLGLQGTVASRWIQSIETFLPSEDGVAVDRVYGARLTFAVSYIELSPQYIGQTLDEINATVKRAEDGQVLIVSDYTIT